MAHHPQLSAIIIQGPMSPNDRLKQIADMASHNERLRQEAVRNTGFFIDDFCMETYPCRHLTIFPDIDSVCRARSKTDIYNYLTSRNIQIPPHFKLDK